MKSDNEKIDRAIRFYEDQKNEILYYLDGNENLSADLIIKNGKDLELIATKIDALFVAKNN